MDINDREVWVGKSRYYLGEDNIIYITTVGDIDEKAARESAYHLNRFESMTQGKVHALIDLNKAGKQSSEARKIWKERSEGRKTDKVAFFGLHPVARIIASFVMGVSRNKNMRFFKTKEEAIAWLKEDKRGKPQK